MGAGFVILIHLVALFILSLTIALLASVITFFFGKKENKKQKILIAFVSPFVGFYTFYIVWLLGTVTVADIKNVDDGIGDMWQAPVSDSCQIISFDGDAFYLERNDGYEVIAEISDIQQSGSGIYGKTFSDGYFAYNTKTNHLETFKSEEELSQHSNIKINLVDATTFYADRINETTGHLFTLVTIGSIAISVIIVFLTRKLILGLGFLGKK